MNWKLFTIVCVSVSLSAVPQNMIGCGPDVDPYDYYAHFFNADQWEGDKTYRPFYYTGNAFLYDGFESDPAEEQLIDEWVKYTGPSVSSTDAGSFIMGNYLTQMSELYQQLGKKKPILSDTSFAQNSMTKYFIKRKDREGLQYLIYAKKVEPYVTGDAYDWDAMDRDSFQMDALFTMGLGLYKTAKKDFYKLRYAYQLVRLAHYNEQYAQAVKLYDSLVAPNHYPSVLQHLSLAQKGGALYKLGRREESAYIFSRSFNASMARRESNYLSFRWSVDPTQPMDTYLAYCKNDAERADMMALFGFATYGPARHIMEEMYRITPASPALEVLAVREINKAEETFYSPYLHGKKGGYNFYYFWEDDESVRTMQEKQQDVFALADLMATLSRDARVKNKGLYATGAAYLYMMVQDFARANQMIQEGERYRMSAKVKDQWTFTRLMIALNESTVMDAATEEKILPSLQWALQKALDEKYRNGIQYEQPQQWIQLYRNLMNVILAKKYNAEGNRLKEALAVGAAYFIYGDGAGIGYVRNTLTAGDVHAMYNLYTEQNPSAFNRFIIQNNSIRLTDVIDFAGTAYLREHDFKNAVAWLEKTSEGAYRIDKNPFIDLLYDRESPLPEEHTITTKLEFAREMLRLQQLSSVQSKDQAAHLYKLGLGLYNMSYYGYAWELVEYFRSGTDGYFIPEDADYFKREYYGVFAAHETFKNAMEATKDKEMKARCLFMMAKCAQKQVQQPQYHWRNVYEHYSNAYKLYDIDFKMNQHFPELISKYGKTRFYQEAYNSCSYLRDFVQRQSR
ncbi:MAG: hypothetical protein KF880_03695 [Ferruginibacter sp.]|nr:hypothetical protein [Ferruginibacter sp.]